MKIAMIGQRGVPATFGGVERHVEELGARLAADGHEVVVFCRRGYGESEPERYRGMRLVHQHTVDSKHLESFVASGTATVATLGRGYDVVHYHAVGPGLFSPIVRGLSGARVVQTIHGLDGERAKWGRGAERAAALRDLAQRSRAAPDDRRLEVAPAGLSGPLRARDRAHRQRHPGGHPASAAAITERWGLTRGSYVLSVGRLVPEKAPEHLLAAFADVPGDTRLVLAGGSSHTDEYVRQLHSMAASDPRVIMAGYVYGAELEELYSNAAVFVLPSLLEGLPLTLLEAASYGRSIVVSDIPPHVEVVGSCGPGARLFPTGDIPALTKALTEALQAPRDEERAGAEALSARVRATYSWDRATSETEALYAELVARKGNGPVARCARVAGDRTRRRDRDERGSPSGDHRPRVLLVTGFGRSGTTLVNTILGSTPGVFAAGEVRFLWERGLVEGRRCGCGEPLQRCPVWGPVLEKAFGSPSEVDPAASSPRTPASCAPGTCRGCWPPASSATA